jgi:hypothetical protein
MTPAIVRPSTAFWLVAGAFVLGLVQIPTHEAAHAAACFALDGGGSVLAYNIALGTVGSGLPEALEAAAGPLLGLLLCFLAITVSRAKRPAGAPGALCIVSIFAFRPLALGCIYLSKGAWEGQYMSFDETLVAAALRVPSWAAVLPSLGLSLILLAIAVRPVPPTALPAWLASITAGGLLGTLVWMRVLGPVLLPW